MTSTTLGVTARPCPVCGKPYESKAGSCSPSCGGVLAARTRGWQAQRLGRQCEICGQTYRATYSAQRTCSRTCGNVLRFGPPKPKPVPVQVTLRLATCPICSTSHLTTLLKDYCERHVQNRYQPKPTTTHECQHCGDAFTTAYSGKPGARRTIYCGDQCRMRALRRARAVAKGKFKVSPKIRRDIYLRDGWTCHLCHAIVQPTTHEPWSASLDHLTPRSQGGSDDPSNLATAHLWCNWLRGTDPIPIVWPHGLPPPSW